MSADSTKPQRPVGFRLRCATVLQDERLAGLTDAHFRVFVRLLAVAARSQEWGTIAEDPAELAREVAGGDAAFLRDALDALESIHIGSVVWAQGLIVVSLRDVMIDQLDGRSAHVPSLTAERIRVSRARRTLATAYGAPIQGGSTS
jgi:hypothetical protein